jgi:hypothetical protein
MQRELAIARVDDRRIGLDAVLIMLELQDFEPRKIKPSPAICPRLRHQRSTQTPRMRFMSQPLPRPRVTPGKNPCRFRRGNAGRLTCVCELRAKRREPWKHANFIAAG